MPDFDPICIVPIVLGLVGIISSIYYYSKIHHLKMDPFQTLIVVVYLLIYAL